MSLHCVFGEYVQIFCCVFDHCVFDGGGGSYSDCLKGSVEDGILGFRGVDLQVVLLRPYFDLVAE